MINDGKIEKQNEEELIQLYKNLLVTSSSHEIQINLDIPRTTRSHIMFISEDSAGQKSLFNILKAFSNHDQQVGYCQGMASVAAILLIYYLEELAFVMLIKLFNKLKLHDLYIPGFPSLLESFYIQEMLMEKYALKISKHLKKNEIRTATYATRWYLTLFTSEVVPHHTLLRFWDLLMLYGFDISYYIAVGLLKYNKYKLINFDFDDTMLHFLSVGTITGKIMDKEFKNLSPTNPVKKRLDQQMNTFAGIQNVSALVSYFNSPIIFSIDDYY
ncbi:15091_t:CDS:2 [Entrophospora sp. SA101]|nr:15091_t:CDS:2 [Entrophospora sp. SA101]